jgi:hypothetical protein
MRKVAEATQPPLIFCHASNRNETLKLLESLNQSQD